MTRTIQIDHRNVQSPVTKLQTTSKSSLPSRKYQNPFHLNQNQHNPSKDQPTKKKKKRQNLGFKIGVELILPVPKIRERGRIGVSQHRGAIGRAS